MLTKTRGAYPEFGVNELNFTLIRLSEDLLRVW